MQNIVRSNSSNADFIELVKLLDADLAIRDGDEHDFYHQFNNIDVLNHVVIFYDEKVPLGCGAFKEYASEVIELKRMYTNPSERGKGIAMKVLAELESWARELGYKKCVLETGIKMPEAIGLYTKTGYNKMPNYGPYAGKDLSRCFEKQLD